MAHLDLIIKIKICKITKFLLQYVIDNALYFQKSVSVPPIPVGMVVYVLMVSTSIHVIVQELDTMEPTVKLVFYPFFLKIVYTWTYHKVRLLMFIPKSQQCFQTFNN